MRIKKVTSCASRGRAVGGGKWHESEHQQELELRSPEYSNAITGVQKDSMIMIEYCDPIKF